MDAVKPVDMRVCIYIYNIYVFYIALKKFVLNSFSRSTAADGPWSAVSRKLQVTWCVPHELLISTILTVLSWVYLS